MTIVLQFHPDGTGSMGEEAFEWTAEGTRLTLTDSEDTIVYDYTLRMDGLTISGGDLDQPMILTQVGKSTEAPRTAGGKRNVTVNQQRVSDQIVAEFEQVFMVRLMDGDYWYDRRSGLWGLWGGPCAGQILPNLNLGGPLPENASSGNTGVWFNGRQLHPYDVMALQRLVGVVYPGRWWIDASGIGGPEGGPAMFNLVQAAQQRSGGGGGNNSWIHRSGNTGIGASGDGNFTYVMGKDWSVSVGH